MATTNSSNKFTIIIGFGFISVLCLSIFLGYQLLKINKLSTKEAPKNDNSVFSFTVTSIPSAKIIGISGNQISIQFDTASIPNPNLLLPIIPPSPTPGKLVTYKIVCDDKTTISKTLSAIPYVFKVTTKKDPSAAKISDLNIGDIITVALTDDIRTAVNFTAHASAISANPISNTYSGTITKLQGSSFSMKATQPPTGTDTATPAPAKDITVNTTSDTEMVSVKMVAGIPDFQKIKTSDLAVGSNIVVFTEIPSTTSNINAAKIDLISPELAKQNNQ